MAGPLSVCFNLKQVIGVSQTEVHLLIGWENDAGVLEVVNCVSARNFDASGGVDWNAELEFLSEHLPSGNVLQVVGVCGQWPVEKYDFRQAAGAVAADTTGSGSSKRFPVARDLVIGSISQEDEIVFQSYSMSKHSLGAVVEVQSAADSGVCPSALAEQSVACRVTAQLGFSFLYTAKNASSSCQSLGTQMGQIEERLSSDRSAFFVDSSLVANDSKSTTTVGDLCRCGGASKQRTQKRSAPVCVRHTYQMSLPADNTHVPIIGAETCVDDRVHVSCPLDAMLLVRSTTPAPEFRTLCTLALSRQLTSMCDRMVTCIKDGSTLQTVRAHHFNLLHTPHHTISVLYTTKQLGAGSGEVAEDSLESTRRELHHRFNLPLNQPLLRKHMTVDSSGHGGPYLTNVHIGLKLASAIGGTVTLVQGVYAYHHYMQDKFNDDGWGCAYRSLQTLWSWFKHQGYTGLAVPTHKQIQQALVDVEDKPLKFVGSRQWIGSIEVQTVLNQLLQIDSRILFVMNGASMPSNAREIAMHFEQQGTPIMIGGGTLAHTIIGIDFNDRTGDVRFLILDPHYTGGEDVGLIQNKGWCGWKNASFWNQQAHYNMCMPLRPDII